MSTEERLPPAAWYVDPGSDDQIRYWDGESWTEHVAPLDTVADMHTGHFESIRHVGRRGLGLAESAGRIHVQHRPAEQPQPSAGAHFELEPPPLGSGWFVSEGLALGSEGIVTEHVVVGSPGVFLLMSRDHSESEVWVAERSFLVDGHNTDYLREARDASRALARLLESECGREVPVRTVIVVKAKELTVKAQPLDAYVVSSKLLGRWFMRLEPVLDEATVAAITSVTGATASAEVPAGDTGPEHNGRRSFASPQEPTRTTRRSLFS